MSCQSKLKERSDLLKGFGFTEIAEAEKRRARRGVNLRRERKAMQRIDYPNLALGLLRR